MSQSPETSEYGLEDDWSFIQQTLEEIIPVYDRTNRYISLGTDLKLRRRGIDLLLNSYGDKSFSLLDLGCGTGSMTRLLREKASIDRIEILLVDPLSKMMHLASFKTKEDGLLAVYEYLPFRPGTVDACMAGFSLRDARNLFEALQRIYGLLKTGGKFLIVDLSKPDSETRRSFISIYWKIVAPVIAFISSGRLGLKFGALSKTYHRLPTISQFLKLAGAVGYSVQKSEFSLMGGACVILLSKERNEPTS